MVARALASFPSARRPDDVTLQSSEVT
jgi:hypothetical protein